MAWSEAARKAAAEARRRKAKGQIYATFKQPVVLRDAAGKQFSVKKRSGGYLTTTDGKRVPISKMTHVQFGHLVKTKKGWGYRRTWSKIR